LADVNTKLQELTVDAGKHKSPDFSMPYEFSVGDRRKMPVPREYDKDSFPTTMSAERARASGDLSV
jgi:hypothetical protein